MSIACASFFQDPNLNFSPKVCQISWSSLAKPELPEWRQANTGVGPKPLFLACPQRDQPSDLLVSPIFVNISTDDAVISALVGHVRRLGVDGAES